VCDGVEWKEGTTVAGGGTWSLGVAAELMETTQVWCTWRFDAWTNSRWRRIFAKVEFVAYVSNISVRVGLRLDLCCIVDRIRVVLESDSCSLGLPYNVRGCHTM
jgi:hypothetical protein